MPRVVHFEIYADDPYRASAFYKNVFGWEIEKWNGPQDYWIVKTGEGPGIDGGMTKRLVPSASDSKGLGAYVCTIDVPEIDECMTRIAAYGGAITVPKMAVPKTGWLAYCKDTEGNTFGILSFDENAV
jgi:predicted enzyme related to lactoylglutathione lyase